MKPNSQAAKNNPDVHFVEDERAEALPLETQADATGAHGHRTSKSQTQEKKIAQEGTPTSTKGRAFLRFVVVVLGIAGTSAACYYTYKALSPEPKGPSALGAPPPVVTVSTAAAKSSMVDENLSVTGSVNAWDELKVGVEVGGLLIKSIKVEEGDKVKKGQILAELNSGLLQAKLSEAKARLSSSLANLSKTQQPNRPEDIAMLSAALAQADSNVTQEEAHKRQAKVNLENAELNARRYGELNKMGAVSVQELETREVTRDNANLELMSAEHKVEGAHRQVEQAKQRLLLAQRGGRKEDVLISKATVEEIKAQIKHLSEEIDQTIVRAPDDGVILKRDAHIGDTSELSKALFTMIRLNRLELRAQVNDTDLFKFKAGQPVAVSTNESDIGTVLGKVRLVSPQVDQSSRLGTVRIDLPANCGLKPGMFVRGETTISRHRALTVPVNCVVTRSGESFVFTLDGNRAVSTPVKTGIQTDKYVEIKSGLSPGQLVIDKGARFLSDRDVVDLPQEKP